MKYAKAAFITIIASSLTALAHPGHTENLHAHTAEGSSINLMPMALILIALSGAALLIKKEIKTHQ